MLYFQIGVNKLKICFKDFKTTYIFGFSSIISFLFIIGLLKETYKDYVNNYLNSELLVSILILFALVYLLFYSILLIKCNNYSIALEEYHLDYKSLFSYKIQYTDINEVIMLVLPTRGRFDLNILKIKLTNGRAIRLRVDKLKHSEYEDIIDAFMQITGKEIVRKVRFLFW